MNKFVEITSVLANNPIYILGILGFAISVTFLLKGVQFRYFIKGWQGLFKSTGVETEGISSFKAASLSIAGRVGSGNVSGVTFAIIAGGPGAIFWMWVMAVFSMATSFVETVLSQIYKEKTSENIYVGGPMYYMEKGLKSRALGIFFAIVMIMSFGLMFVAMHTDTIQVTFMSAFGLDRHTPFMIILYIGLLLLVAYTAFGGMRRITDLTSKITPVMTIGYLLFILIIVFQNIAFVPHFFQIIFHDAFTGQAIAGGALGTVIASGVKRGIFSNEAGQGSGAIAAASAEVDHPVEQGMTQMITVFIDTVLICTSTAFVVILFGSELGWTNFHGMAENLNNSGSAMVSNAFTSEFAGPIAGAKVLALFLFVFSFTSIIAVIAYGKQSVKFLFKYKTENTLKIAQMFYSIGVVLMVAITPILSMKLGQLFTISDNLASLLFYSNIIAMILLFKHVKEALKDYESGNKKYKFKNVNFKVSDDMKDAPWNT